MNWKQAFALGLCSVGDYKGEPVAYLYNGVRLPKVPEPTEWDRKTHPYAYITAFRFGEDVVYSFNVAIVKGIYSEATTPLGVVSGLLNVDGFISWSVNSESNRWGNKEVHGDGSIYFSEGSKTQYLVWCNADVYREDGSLLLSATDPIPVYA